MTGDRPTNIAASVRRRLLTIIRETGDDANLIWTRYATERFLYRLSISEYASEFVLKGAMLFTAWTGQSYRPTFDIDLLGRGEDSSERLAEVFRAICTVEVEPDGLVFDPDTVSVTPIREGRRYQGRRVKLAAFLGKARIPVQVDVGFGDVITPKAEKIEYPTLLDFPAPLIRTCPRETVVAEKLQAMVELGIANSRMKDFYDLYVLARDFAFDGQVLTRAIKATFERRETAIPSEPPLALTEEFGRDGAKSVQWRAFIRKSGLEEGVPDFPDVIKFLGKFLLPPLRAASGSEPAPGNWDAAGHLAIPEPGD
ncbi:MAG TPA: nucleotidyl transferase AbiEii/AbiGii toxin family protein [Spirochaetia bacterium]|nr:nucleotidyl transferase AbiEii/AbiGii toxin family protein [Spirochaetia bacterium]